MVKINGRCLCEYCFAEIGKKNSAHDCGGDNRGKYPNALAAGSVLAGRYAVGKVLGQGGFGITYLCYDTKEEKRVAVKEFFPASMVCRKASDSTVLVSAPGKEEDYDRFKKKFYHEASTIARFNGHPNIVRVLLFFEENNTAYFSMEYLEGMDLKQYILSAREQKKTVTEGNALFVLQTVANALLIVHSIGVIHRDVAPDNIFVCQDGTLKLIDFGASRFFFGSATRTLTSFLKFGFAPIEQYQTHGNQGPWTDIYALGTTIYVMLTDQCIPDSPSRISSGAPIEQCGISDELFRLLEKMLAIYPKDRPQSIVELNRLISALSIQPQPLIPSACPGPETLPAEESETERLSPVSPLNEAFRLLKQKDWAGADACCDEELMKDPDNVHAYLGKLLAEQRVPEAEQLRTCRKSFQKSGNYIKIVQLGERGLIDKLNGYLGEIKRRRKKMAVAVSAAVAVCICVVLAVYFRDGQLELPASSDPSAASFEITTDAERTEPPTSLPITTEPPVTKPPVVLPAVGTYVQFGRYEQDNLKSTGAEPLVWIVTGTKDYAVTLRSLYVIDTVPYADSSTATWESSSLRDWLNNDFYQTAFSADEQREIQLTWIENPANHEFHIQKSGSTYDKVFINSISDEFRSIAATKYAAAKDLVTYEKGLAAYCWMREPYYCRCDSPGYGAAEEEPIWFTAGVCPCITVAYSDEFVKPVEKDALDDAALAVTRFSTGTYYVIPSVGLRLREGPSTESRHIMSLPQGREVEVTEIYEDDALNVSDAERYWGKINYDGWTVWASMAYLEKDKAESDKSAADSVIPIDSSLLIADEDDWNDFEDRFDCEVLQHEKMYSGKYIVRCGDFIAIAALRKAEDEYEWTIYEKH